MGVRIAVLLAAEAHETPIEEWDSQRIDDAVETLIARYGTPTSWLLDAWGGRWVPRGWLYPASLLPDAFARTAPLSTSVGPIRVPGPYVEVRPIALGLQGSASLLPRWTADPTSRDWLSSAGLAPESGLDLSDLMEGYGAAGQLQRAGDYQGAAARFIELSVRYWSLGAVKLAADCYDNLGAILHEYGDHEAAMSLHRWSLGVYRRERWTADEAACLSNLGHVLWHANLPGRALAVLDDARNCYRAVADPAGVALTQYLDAYALADVGRGREARSSAAAARMTFESQGNSKGVAWCEHATAYALLRSGCASGSLTYAAAAVRRLGIAGDRLGVAEGEELLAEVLTAGGRPLEAQEAYRRAKQAFNALGLDRPWVSAIRAGA